MKHLTFFGIAKNFKELCGSGTDFSMSEDEDKQFEPADIFIEFSIQEIKYHKKKDHFIYF